jgi:hypothetical protein
MASPQLTYLQRQLYDDMVEEFRNKVLDLKVSAEHTTPVADLPPEIQLEAFVRGVLNGLVWTCFEFAEEYSDAGHWPGQCRDNARARSYQIVIAGLQKHLRKAEEAERGTRMPQQNEVA